jgi:protease-4
MGNSMANGRSLPARIGLGIWHFINGSRKVFLNLLFLLFLYFLYLAFFHSAETLRLKPDTTLVIRPYGSVVEQYSTTPLDRALEEATGQMRSETRLRDMMESIHRGAGDSSIKQLVIDPSFMTNAGMATLKDLGHAIDAFRSTGKPIVAIANNLDQQQYYLASLADEIWLNPGGTVWIDGFSSYRQYYKEGLEKLAVQINLFRVGEYKSAMEPYVRNDMSPQAEEAGKFWLNNLWQQYLEGVSKHRGIPLMSLQQAIDEFPARIEAVDGDFAQFALQTGLVDRLMTAPQIRQELAIRGAVDLQGDGYRAVDMLDYLTLTPGPAPFSTAKRIAVVIAEGEIVPGQYISGAIGSLSTAEQLRRVARDDKVAAVVVRINSPGGDANASEALRLEIQQVRDTGKKVVISMGDVAASGGYWMAMSADEVWASPATITGSIGVFGMIPTFEQTLEKVGVHTDGFGTTELAGKLRLDRSLDPAIARLFQASTERVYRQFLELVASARGFDSLAAVDEVAQGRVWSGQQAMVLGLVDKTGTFQDAIEASARIAGLGEDYQLDWIEPEQSALDEFFAGFASNAIVKLNLRVSQPISLPVSWVQGLLDDLNFIASRNGKFTIAAYCMCELQ